MSIPGVRVSVAVGALASILGVGCSSNGDGSGTAAIALQMRPAAVTVEQGGATQVTGVVTRTGFSGPVTVTIDSMPAGVVATVVASPAAGQSTARISVNGSPGAVLGDYTVTVRASGSGVAAVTASFVVTIVAASAADSIEVSGSAPVLVIDRGGSGTETLTINRVNTDAVANVSVDYVPSGIVAAITPTSLAATDGTSYIRFDVSPEFAPGVYFLTVRVVAPGLGDQTYTVEIDVPDDASSSSTVKLWVNMQGTGSTQRAGTVYLYVGDAATNRFSATIAASTYNCYFADPMQHTCEYDIPRGKTVTLIATNPARTGEDTYLTDQSHPLPVNAADTVHDGSAFEFRSFDPPDCKTTSVGECVLLMDQDRSITVNFRGVHLVYLVMTGIGNFQSTIDSARPQLAIPAATANPDVGRIDPSHGYEIIPDAKLIAVGRYFSGTTVTYHTLPIMGDPNRKNFLGWGPGTFCANGGETCSIPFNDTDFGPVVVRMRFRYWICGTSFAPDSVLGCSGRVDPP